MSIDDQDCAADLQADLERIQTELDVKCRQVERLRALLMAVVNSYASDSGPGTKFPYEVPEIEAAKDWLADDEQKDTSEKDNG